MSFNFTTSGAAIAKAGAGANSTITGRNTELDLWSDMVEGKINTLTRIDWITNPPSTNFAGILSDIASDLIATKIIAYDMSGYIGTEGQTMLDVLKDNSDKSLNELTKQEVQEKM